MLTPADAHVVQQHIGIEPSDRAQRSRYDSRRSRGSRKGFAGFDLGRQVAYPCRDRHGCRRLRDESVIKVHWRGRSGPCPGKKVRRAGSPAAAWVEAPAAPGRQAANLRAWRARASAEPAHATVGQAPSAASLSPRPIEPHQRAATSARPGSPSRLCSISDSKPGGEGRRDHDHHATGPSLAAIGVAVRGIRYPAGTDEPG